MTTAIRNAHIAICEHKRRFERKATAKRYCKQLVREGRSPLLRPYLCPVCRQFHLTRNKQY